MTLTLTKSASTPWRLAAALLVVAAAVPATAAEEALPPAEEILDQNVQAMGGEAAFAAVDNIVARGSLEVVGAGIGGTLTVYTARPALSSVVFEAEGLGTVRSGTDGTVAWEYSDLQGPRLLEGDESEFTMRSARVDGDLRWRELFDSAVTVGLETVDGRPCYKLVMTPKVGKPETWYIDRESKLLVKQVMTLVHAMGEVPVEVTISDYRDVGGIKTAFLSTQKLLGQQMRTALESVEHNVEIPPGQFDLPPEIEALLAARQGAGAAPGEGPGE